VSELEPRGSVVKALWQVPPLRVHVPSVVVPFLKVTVPVAAEGDTLAVSVTLPPTAALVAEEDSVVVVAVAAWALVTIESRNRSRIATLPQLLRMLVEVAGAPLRVAAPGEVRISDILKPSVMNHWLSRSQRAMGIDRLGRRSANCARGVSGKALSRLRRLARMRAASALHSLVRKTRILEIAVSRALKGSGDELLPTRGNRLIRSSSRWFGRKSLQDRCWHDSVPRRCPISGLRGA
jgi:hypothetical protein